MHLLLSLAPLIADLDSLLFVLSTTQKAQAHLFGCNELAVQNSSVYARTTLFSFVLPATT